MLNIPAKYWKEIITKNGYEDIVPENWVSRQLLFKTPYVTFHVTSTAAKNTYITVHLRTRATLQKTRLAEDHLVSSTKILDLY